MQITRRGMLSFTAALALVPGSKVIANVTGQKISPRPDVPTTPLMAAEYLVDVQILGSPEKRSVSYFYMTLRPGFPEGVYYPTRVLERLRAAGIIQPNNPAQNQFFVTMTTDVFFQAVTVQAGDYLYTIESGGFWFLVNEELVFGNGVSVAGYDIEARSRVGITLAPAMFATYKVRKVIPDMIL